MSVTRRKFMEGTVQAAVLSILSQRAFGAGSIPENAYALNPAFQYLRTWVPPMTPYVPGAPLVLEYDMIDWKAAPDGTGKASNTVVGKLILSRGAVENGQTALQVKYSSGHDRWSAEVVCREDAWCTPEEWTFRSEPTAPHAQCQNLVVTGFQGKNRGNGVDITHRNGRTHSVPFAGPLTFPFAQLTSPEKWAHAAGQNRTMSTVRDLYHLMPDQRFVDDGHVRLPDGSSVSAFIQHGTGWVPANFVSGPTGLPLAFTAFLISFILTNATPGGDA